MRLRSPVTRHRATLGLAAMVVLAALGGCSLAAPPAAAPPPPSQAAATQTEVVVSPAPAGAGAATVGASSLSIVTADPPSPGAAPDEAGVPGAATVPRQATPSVAPGAATAAAPDQRPPPPPDPGTGIALTIDGAGTNDRLQIALTFDAGEDRGYAEDILDYLRDEGIPATFGMTGRWAKENPDLVRRMAAEGHQLMNHTYDHKSFTGVSTGAAPLTDDQIFDQLARTEAIVAEITGGYAMKPYFRFPYGDGAAAERELQLIAAAGYYLNIYWTCDSYGWKLGVTGADVSRRCTTEALPHEITLLHVGAGAAADFEGLPLLVDFYRDAGYEFVTVEQMLQP